jgi:hypothetical protein
MKKLIKTILFFLAFELFVKFANADLIVNESVIETQISREEAVKIFLFYQKFWNRNGARITVILPPPDSVLFKKLAIDELNLGPTDYYESVKAKMFAGAAQPIFAQSESEIIIKVANTPYSIGYYHGTFKFNSGYGIKTLTIQ